MRFHNTPIACCGFVAGALLVAALAGPQQRPVTVMAADVASAADSAPAKAAAEAGAEARRAELAEEQQALNVKYARIYLQLAQVNLQKAVDFNRRVPGGFSEAEVDRLRRLVAYGEERLQWMQKAGHRQSDANVFSAENALQSAEGNYQKAKNANTRVPGAVSPLELERLRLTAELARMGLEKAKLAAESNSSVADVQWELDQLREDVLQLRSRVEAITARR